MLSACVSVLHPHWPALTARSWGRCPFGCAVSWVLCLGKHMFWHQSFRMCVYIHIACRQSDSRSDYIASMCTHLTLGRHGRYMHVRANVWLFHAGHRFRISLWTTTWVAASRLGLGLGLAVYGLGLRVFIDSKGYHVAALPRIAPPRYGCAPCHRWLVA